MLIVSKIERQGGSRITVSGKTYDFEPNEKTGLHMCEVADKDHAARLLAISEGFEAFDPDDVKDLRLITQGPQKTPEQSLEDQIEPGGNEPDDPTDDDESDAQAEEAEAKLENAIEPDQDDGLDDLGDLDLVHAYEDALGKPPAKNMKRATMIKHIRKANAAKKD